MFYEEPILLRCLHCDIWHPDAFGPASWSLPFGPEPMLRDFSWEWREGEVWAVVGSNTSGKDALAYMALGKGRVWPRNEGGEWKNKFLEEGEKGCIVSFLEAEKALQYSLRFDDSDFVEGGVHPGLTVEGFINQHPDSIHLERRELRQALGIEAILHRGLKRLSTGELRKVLLYKAILDSPSVLICEDLMEGLDQNTRFELERFFHVENRSRDLLFLCDREDQILPSVTHVLRLSGGRIVSKERRNGSILSFGSDRLVLNKPLPNLEAAGNPVLRMRNIHVAYDGWSLFTGFHLEIYPGEHCFIQGPNGCGKSTLVRLITGDHPQAWVNDISVAGIQRGTQEKIQDVRMQTSLVSHELHRAFLSLEDITTLEVVISGFFCTVGVYEPVGEYGIQRAHEALSICGIEGYGKTLFKDLSWGIQRLVLAARAFVRRSPLMILDEPCTGLDEEHRSLLLTTLERMIEESSQRGMPTLLFVSHDPAERIPSMQADLICSREGFNLKGPPRYQWSFYSS